MKLLTLLYFFVALMGMVSTTNGLFGKDKGGKGKGKDDADSQALDDVHTGFAGISQAMRDPHMMSDLMQSLNDPEIMAEANKMMQDPAFQRQMKAFLADKDLEQISARAKSAMDEIANDPEKLAQVTRQMEAMMRPRDENLDRKMRANARARAGAELGVGGESGRPNGAQNAALGFETLKSAANDPAVMREAMELMNDPAMMAEVRRMVQDPAFVEQVKHLSSDPQWQATMQQGAQVMNDMMGAQRARGAA